MICDFCNVGSDPVSVISAPNYNICYCDRCQTLAFGEVAIEFEVVRKANLTNRKRLITTGVLFAIFMIGLIIGYFYIGQLNNPR
jgi:hypothetical protein